MAEVTVKQLAQVVGTPVEKLLEQLRDAGVDKAGETDAITDTEKVALLSHLRQSRGESGGDAGTKRIGLRRKRVSELKSDSAGRKKVSVEVRAKRTFVKPQGVNAAPAAEAAPGATPAVNGVARADAPEATAPASPSATSESSEVESKAAESTVAEPESAVSAESEPATAEQTAASVEQTSPSVSATVESQIEAEVQAEMEPVAPASTVPDVADEPAPPADVPATSASTADTEPEPVEPDVEGSASAAARAADESVRAQVEAAAASAVAAEVERAAEQAARAQAEAATPAAPVDPAEVARKQRAAEARLAAEEKARSAAERQAEKQVAATRRQESEENAKRDTERREQERVAAELQRRAAVEAQQAASSTDRGGAGAGRGKDARGRGRGKGGGAGDTRYGRNQLHVAKDKSGRRKGKPRRALPANFEAKHGFERPTAPLVRDVEVPETITVAELGNKMAVKANEVIRAMMGMGVMATINQMLDQDTAILVVEEMGHRAVAMSADDIELALATKVAGEQTGDTAPRAPVVTIMGHVDHGKTSLLDYIRKAKVADGEAGGITQHIGAYQTRTDNGVITFLDTPGHAAFTSMRARGAQATDIVVLVVAADDGAMPQTVEAIQHSKAAGVPIIVAMNKMDKEGVDPERVRSELAQHDVISEEWGGDVQFIPVSAHTGAGIDKLLEAITLQAEVLELSAVPEGKASGVVVEASLDKGRGPVATVLVQNGVLKRGDIFICGPVTGRVRAMFNAAGEAVDEAGPSVPVEVLGLSATPNAGDEMLVAADDRSARELADLRQDKQRDQRLAARQPAKLEDVFAQVKSGEIPTINLLVKADVKGSFEAIRDSLEKLSTDEVSIRIIGGGVGGITESDANLAAASGAILVGFNVRADGAARRLIQEQETELRYYSVIYELIDLVKTMAGGLLAPEVRERIIGNAEVREVFNSPKFGLIAGCMVTDGVVRKEEPIRVLRDNVVIYEGALESLRRFKDDVTNVHMGTECGIGVKNYTDVKPGDVIEVFERTEVARTL